MMSRLDRADTGAMFDSGLMRFDSGEDSGEDAEESG